jgi:glycosyltransferase involved in cell wall biosynthesis
LKICLLCYRGNPYSGGQGIYLKYVAEELVRQGHEVHAIVGPPYPLQMEGVTVHYIDNNEYFIKKGKSVINSTSPFNIFHPINIYEYFNSRFGAFPEISSFSYRAFFKLRSLMKNINFNIVHDNQCLGYGLLLMKSLDVPVIATIHHPLTIDLENVVERATSFFNKLKAVIFYPILMQKFVAKRIDHIITVSLDSKKRIHQSFGVPLDRQTVVYNGLDRAIFKPISDIRKIRDKILFVGNVEDGKKGFAYLLKALKILENRVHLTIVDGGSPHRKATDRLIKRLGLEDKISFTGKVSTEELVQHYNESVITLVPSTYEGFGFPAAEAMSCGVPVISSDGGALPEIVGDAGMVVPARDECALAEAIDSLISDKKRLREMGDAGKKRIEKYFNWKTAVKQMIEVYERFV